MIMEATLLRQTEMYDVGGATGKDEKIAHEDFQILRISDILRMASGGLRSRWRAISESPCS